jgi:hypothetical protein
VAGGAGQGWRDTEAPWHRVDACAAASECGARGSGPADRGSRLRASVGLADRGRRRFRVSGGPRVRATRRRRRPIRGCGTGRGGEKEVLGSDRAGRR